MSEVVISEAVVLDLQPARLPRRAVALTVDALIMAALGLILLIVVSLVGSDFDGALAAAVLIAVIVVILVGYPVLWETLTRGRSPGKYAMGLRVVRDDAGPIRFRHALTRALTGLLLDFGVVAGGTGIVAVVVSLGSERGKRLGDLMAGTIVVRERVPSTGTAEPPPVDPRLAAWATGLELAGLPDDLALTARRFLARAPELDPRVRASMADRVAGDVAARLAPPPPAGLPPEHYLAAVLGERRRRETERLARWRPAAAPGGPPASGTPWSVPVPAQATGPSGTPHAQPPVSAPPVSAPPGSAPSVYAPPGSAPRESAPSTGFAPPG